MKKLYIILLLIAGILAANAQTSTETFEDETFGNNFFTDNGVKFNINSLVQTFTITTIPNNIAGWTGSTYDYKFISNFNSRGANASFSIKTTSNLFRANRFWIIVSRDNNLAAVGTLTITGKLSGVTKFSQTKTTGFNTSFSNSNGYTLIDMTNFNGQNYSNITIDELTFTLGGNYNNMLLDAFTWVKDNHVLSVNDTEIKMKSAVYPNPAHSEVSVETAAKGMLGIYDLSGKLVKSATLQGGKNTVDIAALPRGVYIFRIATGDGVQSQKVIKN